jgi:UDP-N-acetylglucosamine 3-dehydrogenase
MVKIGVIGGGKWGKNHLKDFSRISACELVGLSDIDPAKKELAEQYNIQHFFDYKEMLPLVEAVTIVVPTNHHYSIAKECLEQGKHVFIEKPICFEPQQAEELVHLAEEKGLVLSVGYVFRFNPLVKRLKELIPAIGPIQYISGRYIHSSVPPRKDSGVIFNLGIHLFDVLNYVLPDKPKSLFCNKVHHISKNNEDSALININYGSYSANIETSCCHPLKKRDMWIIAAKEKIYLDFLDQVMIRYPLQVSEEGNISKESVRDPQIEKQSPLFAELEHFTQVCNQRKQDLIVVNHSAENLLSTSMCVMAIQSAAENKIINFGNDS